MGTRFAREGLRLMKWPAGVRVISAEKSGDFYLFADIRARSLIELCTLLRRVEPEFTHVQVYDRVYGKRVPCIFAGIADTAACAHAESVPVGYRQKSGSQSHGSSEKAGNRH